MQNSRKGPGTPSDEPIEREDAHCPAGRSLGQPKSQPRLDPTIAEDRRGASIGLTGRKSLERDHAVKTIGKDQLCRIVEDF